MNFQEANQAWSDGGWVESPSRKQQLLLPELQCLKELQWYYIVKLMNTVHRDCIYP
jgi:hypothetical protein